MRVRVLGDVEGIVTRRPLVLQLHQTEGPPEYAEFLHLPKRRFTNFGMLCSDELFAVVVVTG